MPTHPARFTPDIERQLKSNDQHSLVDILCPFSKGMFLALVTVESRGFLGVVICRDVSDTGLALQM